MTRHHPWRGDVTADHPELAEEVLAAVRERGPLASRDFEGKGGGGMWNWKPAKMMLESLWNSGEIVIAGRVSGFQRLYDLAERVIPREVLDAPEPDEATRLRELTLRAVRARGALTEPGSSSTGDSGEGRRVSVRTSTPSSADGLLERVRVDDGGPTSSWPQAPISTRLARPPSALLSPFDNLLWDRPFARRIFGFDHVIEVYKRAHERQFGYYVLPFLWRDRIVGRADLKSERGEGALVVKALHLEPRRPSLGRPRGRVRPRTRPAPPRRSDSSTCGADVCEAPPVHWQLVVLALVLLGFATISRRIDGTWITAAMFFTAAGLVVGVEALGLVDPSAEGVEVKMLAEATLTVVLFSDASRIDLQALRSTLGIPAPPARDRSPADDRRGLRRRPRRPRRPHVARGTRGRDHPRADRCGARPDGGHLCRDFRCGSARASTSRAA